MARFGYLSRRPRVHSYATVAALHVGLPPETVTLELRHCRCYRSVCKHGLQRRR